MKRGGIFRISLVLFIVVIVIFLLIFGMIFANAKDFDLNKPNKKDKIDKKVHEGFKKNKNLKVMVKFKGNYSESSNSSSNLKDFPVKKIRKKFKDRISIYVNESDISLLEQNPNIETVDVVGVKNIFLTESLPLINGTTTQSKQINGINLTGDGESICLLDTGTDFSHQDLVGRNLTCVIDCVSAASCFENCSAGDTNGHGTHMAGIIAASGTAANGGLRGIAPGAKIFSVKVCGDSGCADDDIRAGLDWCITNSTNYNISVISMSLGSTTLYTNYCDGVDDPSDITSAINNAIGKNISVIVATGNNANSTAIASPACIKNSTAVADTYDANIGGIAWTACTDATTYTDKIVCHANRNSLTDLLAPGALINSTYTSHGYSNGGGTSMATPHVAASFAIVNQFKKLEGIRNLTPSGIQSALNTSGKQITDSGGSGLIFSRMDLYTTILDLDEKAPTVRLITPNSNGIINSSTLFRCNSSDELQLSNLTIIIWNSTKTVVNQTTFYPANGNNSLDANLTLNLTQGNYEFNCLSYDKKNNFAFDSLTNSNNNLSLTVNGIFVSLSSPGNGTLVINGTNYFNCSAQTHVSLTNITLFIWNYTKILIYNETKNISGSLNQTNFSYSLLNNTDYYWNCLAFNNESNSSFATANYTLIYQNSTNSVLQENPNNNPGGSGSPGGGSSGGGGGGVNANAPMTYYLSDGQLTIGYNKIIKIEDKLKFNIEKTEHSLTLKQTLLLDNKAVVNIESNLITLILELNKSQKVNINNDDYYDLQITLNSLNATNTNITIMKINEKIPSKELFNN